jgi:hypothetical protein
MTGQLEVGWELLFDAGGKMEMSVDGDLLNQTSFYLNSCGAKEFERIA